MPDSPTNGTTNNTQTKSIPSAKKSDIDSLTKDFDVSERVAKLCLQKFNNNYSETVKYMASTVEYYTGFD